MFGKKKPEDIKIRKFSEIQLAQKSQNQFAQAVDKNLKVVQKMDKKTYLKYYIGVLEKQINEASKILTEKKRELRMLR